MIYKFTQDDRRLYFCADYVRALAKIDAMPPVRFTEALWLKYRTDKPAAYNIWELLRADVNSETFGLGHVANFCAVTGCWEDAQGPVIKCSLIE